MRVYEEHVKFGLHGAFFGNFLRIRHGVEESGEGATAAVGGRYAVNENTESQNTKKLIVRYIHRRTRRGSRRSETLLRCVGQHLSQRQRWRDRIDAYLDRECTKRKRNWQY
jgi:hypothetical protein